MLVYGGTFKLDHGNRAFEDAIQLKPVSENAVRVFETAINQAINLDGIRLALEYIASLNQNIVGTRGYVYSSARLAKLIGGTYLMREPNLLPRTLGLRERYMKLAGLTGD